MKMEVAQSSIDHGDERQTLLALLDVDMDSDIGSYGLLSSFGHKSDAQDSILARDEILRQRPISNLFGGMYEVARKLSADVTASTIHVDSVLEAPFDAYSSQTDEMSLDTDDLIDYYYLPTEALDAVDELLLEGLVYHIESHDEQDASAQLAVILTDVGYRKHILSWEGDAAQSFINILQSLLDSSPLAPHRKLFRHMLIKMCRISGLYPECLIREDLVLFGTDPVAAGRFGEVWKGSLPGRGVVAVKILRVYEQCDVEKLLKEFSTEIVTWRQLSDPNVLPFYGVFHLNSNRSRVCLISPWMEHGNIVQFLKKQPHVDRVPLILDIAQGLEYLHTFRPKIIHGDLKGVNILITTDQRACLADFGLSTVEDSQAIFSASSFRTAGTSRWQAPELLDPQSEDDEYQEHNTSASDVYAFGCVCYEIYSGNIPFHDITTDYRVIVAVMKGIRPSRPQSNLRQLIGDWDEEVWNLIETCWNQQPAKRPSASKVVKQLRWKQTRVFTRTHRRTVSNPDPLFYHPASWQESDSETDSDSGYDSDLIFDMYHFDS